MEWNTTFAAVKEAGRDLLALDDEARGNLLRAIADATLEQTERILQANRRDLERMEPTNPKYDRLMLTAERMQAIADDTRRVAGLPSPLGRVLKETTLPNGLHLQRVSVPFGVIGIIYEARPNVGFDVAALCLKSGNACILKGGSDAACSNQAIAELIQGVLQRHGVNPHAIELLPADREATACLLQARDYVDLIIPRRTMSISPLLPRDRDGSRHLPYLLRPLCRPAEG